MDLQNLIPKIDLLKEELDGYRPIPVAQMNKVMQKFRLDWNFHSNHIEGNQLTYGETKALLLHGLTAKGKPLRDHLDIRGHNEAIRVVEEVVREKRPISEYFIRGLHEIVLNESYEARAITADGRETTKRIEIGQYKKLPNHVLTATGEMFYFAEPTDIPVLMHDLVNWLYEQEKAESPLHPLLIAAQFHYKFICIHPFDDGNGRMARMLMNLILMKNGYPLVIIRTEEKEEYYQALRQADGGDIETFVYHIGERLLRSLQTMIKGVKGEEIGEPSDIDKRIALLQARLQAPKNKEKIYKSDQVLYQLLRDSILPFLQIYLEQLSKIDTLFSEKTISLAIDSWNDSSELLKKLLLGNGHTDKYIQNIYQNEQSKYSFNFKEITLLCKWSHLDIEQQIEPFSYQITLCIHFEADQYIISAQNGSEVVLKKEYNQILTKEDYEQIIKDRTNDVLEKIESNI